MALYLGHDIETDDGGDVLFENGDLKLASVKRSHLQALNFVVLSNRTDLLEADAAANLSVFNGSQNLPRTHRLIEEYVRRAVDNQRLFQVGDLRVRVVPVEPDAVALTVRMSGTYIEDRDVDREDPALGYEVLAYLYPFGTGLPERIEGQSYA